jgi:hypothetical protein
LIEQILATYSFDDEVSALLANIVEHGPVGGIPGNADF